MKKLVIYYSLTGNIKFIAEAIAEATGADILELKTEKELIKKEGLIKYFLGGKKTVMGEKPKIMPLNKNPEDYDVLFIGTPVWACNYTPHVRSFFSQVKLINKKISFFCSSGGLKGKIFENMKKELIGNEFIGEVAFIEPLKNNPEECTRKARQWASDLIKNHGF
ncbi:MAG: flavodoxin [bacterium]